MEAWKKDLYLAHHGILGMKWGIRRFQNPDGSLTAAGRQRYLSGSKTIYGSKSPYDHSESGMKAVTRAAVLAAVAAATPLTIASFGVLDLRMGMASVSAAATLTIGIAKDSTSAIKRAKAENNKKNLDIDEKTGFHLKKESDEDNMDKDCKKVNPGGASVLSKNYSNNCMLCSATYELRRRGFEVTANKAAYGFPTEALQRWFPDAKINGYTIRQGNSKAAEQVKGMLQEQGVGARGSFCVDWRGTYSGHAMNYEVTKDGVKLFDTQSGKEESFEKILGKASKCEYARLDNIDFNSETIKEAAH